MTTKLDILNNVVVSESGCWEWGGVKVHEAKYIDSYWEPMWIDSEEYHSDPNSYKLLGHIDLSKAMSK